MSSYFELELDTTGPNIELNMPSYVSFGDNTWISIVATEDLLINYDLYLIDNQGVRKDLIFELNDNTLEGYLDVTGLTSGIAEVNVQVYDEVMNSSELLKKPFMIYGGNSNVEIILFVDSVGIDNDIWNQGTSMNIDTQPILIRDIEDLKVVIRTVQMGVE